MMIDAPPSDAPVVTIEAPAVEAASSATGTLPDGVRRMVEAAISTGDAKAVETVLRLARSTEPAGSQALDEIENRWKQAQVARAAAARPPRKPWRAQIELGASRSTGKASYLGVVGSVSVNKESKRWRHKGQARYELQRGRNVVPVDRGAMSWQPGYTLSERLYLQAQAQAETDPPQGVDVRYTAGGGIGVAVVKRAQATLEIEGGPALRHTQTMDGNERTALSARAAMSLRLNLSPNLELRQASSLFLEEGKETAASLTSLDAQLIGPLRARLSYDLRYESQLALRRQLDTVSRATLVFSF
jgi:putative salt-induced outer membrane protein